METHDIVFAWEIQWTGSLVGYSPWGRKESSRTAAEHAYKGISQMYTFSHKTLTIVSV